VKHSHVHRVPILLLVGIKAKPASLQYASSMPVDMSNSHILPQYGALQSQMAPLPQVPLSGPPHMPGH
jgi:hypothetical protein